MNKFKAILVTILTLIIGAYIAAIVCLFVFVQAKWVLIGVLLGILLIDLLFGINILISNKYSDIKLCWLFFVLGVPLFGWVFYALFGNNAQSKYAKEKNARGLMFLDKTEKMMKKIDVNEIDSNIRTIFKYNEKASPASICTNNEIEILDSNTDLYKKSIELIRSAKKHINVITFIIKDSVFFSTFCAELIKKAKEGVKVAMIYDWFGAFCHVNKKTLKQLKEAGIRIARFNPPTWNVFRSALNYRNHQKALIVDNEAALYGGSNIADEYLSISKKYFYFKDLNYVLRGKIVSSLTIAFLYNWLYLTDHSLKWRKKLLAENEDIIKSLKEARLSKTESIDHNYMQLVKYMPNITEKTIEQTVVSLIANAKKSIKFATPYFCASSDIVDALKTACISGIDVEIIYPHFSDNKYFMVVNNRKECETLIREGAKAYEYGGFNHAKYLIIDDRYVFTGSNNLDYRSLWMNFENSILIDSQRFAKRLLKVFEEDKRHSIPTDIKQLKNYNSAGSTFLRGITRFIYPLI